MTTAPATRFSSRALSLRSVWFIVLVCVASNPWSNFATGQQGEAKKSPEAGGKKRPVILLTGFEPFGKQRPANPSWEGIKRLHGQEWQGYELVCKEVPVVWGAPLSHLQELISQHKPVAVFSFGQGGARSFALESKATNMRGKYADNLGQKPTVRSIVDNGPFSFDASIDGETLVNLLRNKGYEIRISTRAGRYLCEEMLYTLEYLRSTKRVNGTVMFCHVPPLYSVAGGRDLPFLTTSPTWPSIAPLPVIIGGKTVTRPYMEGFVKDVLESWYVVYQSKIDSTGVSQAVYQKAKDPREQEVREFITHYFRTWSDQDMKGYNACFMADACIQHIDAQGRLTTQGRREFVAGQRDYHQRAPFRTTEVAESTDVRFEENLARAVVYWKLTAGPRKEWGYDHFTLIRHEGNWRIVNLVFYSVPAPGQTRE